MLGGRPLWRVRDSAGRWVGVHADTLAVLTPLDVRAARLVAEAFVSSTTPGEPSTVRARYIGTLTDADQWTLNRTVRRQMPLLRFDLDDATGTRVYVAPHGAEVVNASTRRERLLSWFGAIPHWIYPTMLRRHAEAWAWVVIVLSGLGTLMSVAGVAIGLWQWRWRRRPSSAGRARPRSPYRDRMMRWHHVSGFVFGTVVCTWVFSGLMSMNPGDWSPGSAPGAALLRDWRGERGAESALAASPTALWRAAAAQGGAMAELTPTQLAGTVFWRAHHVDGATTVLDAVGAEVRRATFARETLERHAARMIPDAQVVDRQLLTDYDNYYRDRERLRPLPVLRLTFDDAAGTWLYIDPATGTLAQVREWRSRLERWLYNGLHDFDFAWLISRRPLWDGVVIVLSLGGIACSLTGVVIAWRWLRATTTGPATLRRR
jgi:hypothetical protein